jgi:hypothetical protein
MNSDEVLLCVRLEIDFQADLDLLTDEEPH